MDEKDVQSCIIERGEHHVHIHVCFHLLPPSYQRRTLRHTSSVPEVFQSQVGSSFNQRPLSLSLSINPSCQHSITGSCGHDGINHNFKTSEPRCSLGG